MLATSGSGHAYKVWSFRGLLYSPEHFFNFCLFKFLPVVGRLVADAIQGTMADELVNKFAFDREIPPGVTSPSRPGRVPQELDFTLLCKAEDLLPPE